MTTITILPESLTPASPRYRAIAGAKESTGATAGEALDALTAQMDGPLTTTLVVVQPMQPDAYFTAEQQQRLAELLGRWRAARDGGGGLPAEEQAELDALVEAELRAAIQRSRELSRQLPE